MTISIPVRRPVEISFRLVLLITVVFSLLGLPWAQLDRAAAHGRAAIAAAASDLGRSLLQYKAGSHLLAFQPHQVVMAGLDHALTVEFVDAAPGVTPLSSQGSSSSVSKGVQALSLVQYTGLWQGIDLKYESAGDGFAKSTYTLAPGADAGLIRLRYNVPVALQADGALSFQVKSQQGSLSETAPVAWQEIAGIRQSVPVSFHLLSEGLVGFRLGAYDSRFALTIDPFYQWHTYFGAQGDDVGRALALDAAGNIYIAGTIPNYLKQDAEYVEYVNGGFEIVIIKLNPSGVFQWDYTLGGLYLDSGSAIAVDSSGIYVAGEADSNWSVGGTAPLHAYSGSGLLDLAVVKLNTSGQHQWHTFYGSSQYDQANGIAVNASGVYVTGNSDGSWNGPLPANKAALHGFTGAVSNAYALKLDLNGVYQWHTFYGSTGVNYGNSIALDPTGNVYVAGNSNGSWNGPSPANKAALHGFTVGNEIFVLKLDALGQYLWHTFYGGSGYDVAGGIAVNASTILVGGSSTATWNGQPSGGTPKHAYTSGTDLVALDLDLNGGYKWHTFYGENGNDAANSVTLDGSGNIYLAGLSTISWGSPQNTFDGGSEILALKLDSSGNLVWNTFFGTKGGDEHANDAAVDASGNVFVVGITAGVWPLASLNPYQSGTDIAVVKVNSAGVYQWHTFLSSEMDESADHVAIDQNGNIYIAGEALGSWGTPLHGYTDTVDTIVTKLDSSGNEVWHTYYGGIGYDYPKGIALDASGNIYVVGDSDAAWGAPNQFHDYSGGSDIFVLKLDNNGTYVYHTFYGGAANDTASGIAISRFGSLIVSGISQSTWNGDNSHAPNHAYSGGYDGFVLGLGITGNYSWHTFIGTPTTDASGEVAVDPSGYIYVVGYSTASWKGTNNANPLHAYTGGTDIYIMKLDALGNYVWHTFYGGMNNEYAYLIAMDTSGNVFVTADTGSNWLGDNGASPKVPYSGGQEAVTVKLTKDGAYQWHTFSGSSATDYPYGLAADGSGGVYLVGYSHASWGTPLMPFIGTEQGFIQKLAPDGTSSWNTFWGHANSKSFIKDVALRGNDLVIVGGESYSPWTPGDPQPRHGYTDGNDMLVVKFHLTGQIFLPVMVR